ncbi:hypothetical protein N6L27_03620 [Leisingera sp. SS27]|uniref:hypothetical protein n=1 Tax=Leisingera sp. SS27 TaxID=2979462 RepID=UPI00232CF66A|nr:hypothetical protein [Leisingera sp. SS27]MDC0657079.1 hypothetical protein [Leisingera sp. SS27]
MIDWTAFIYAVGAVIGMFAAAGLLLVWTLASARVFKTTAAATASALLPPVMIMFAIFYLSFSGVIQ